MSEARCPKCQGESVVSGSISAVPGPRTLGVVFRPESLRNFALTFSGGVEFDAKVFACRDCGLMWGSINACNLSEFTDEHCKKPA